MPIPSVDQVTTAGAVGAISSPLWLPTLADISTVSAQIAPILGAAWLVLQIGERLLRIVKGYVKP